MCRYINIAKGQYQPALRGSLHEPTEHRIVDIDSFAQGETGIESAENTLEVFNDMTSNFDDLGYFDAETMLDKLPASQVKLNLQTVLGKMRTEGISPREWTQEDEDSFTIPSWEWGHEKHRGEYGIAIPLPKNEQKKVLMFHLVNLMNA